MPSIFHAPLVEVARLGEIFLYLFLISKRFLWLAFLDDSVGSLCEMHSAICWVCGMVSASGCDMFGPFVVPEVQ